MNRPPRFLRLHHDLSRRLCSSPNPNPNPNFEPLRSTIKALFRLQDLDKLVSDFKTFSDNARFRGKIGVYETTVRRLASAGRLDAVEEILEHQKQYPEAISNEGFAARLILLYGRAGMLDHASATFRSMPRTNLSFNALLTAFSRAGADTDRISALIREIPSSDPSIIPTVITYNIIISALCDKGDLDLALDTLKLMEKSGISPNLITFNTLLNGFYGKGRFADGEKIWTKMKDNNINPDTRSFNAKLRGLVSEGRVSETVEVFNELKRIGLKPDTFTFNALIKGYCQDGKFEEAKKVYTELEENGCAPNLWTFKTLIPVSLEAGEFDFAVKMCNESINSGCYLDVEMLQGVVDGLVKESRLEKAKRLVKHVRSKSYYGMKSLRMPLPCLAV